MNKKFDDLPGWNFEIEEISMNVYEVIGVGPSGNQVQVRGVYPDEVLEQARELAMEILSSR